MRRCIECGIYEGEIEARESCFTVEPDANPHGLPVLVNDGVHNFQDEPVEYDDDQCADPDCRHFREHHGNRGCEQGGYDRKGHDIECLCREFQEDNDASR